MYRLKMRRSDEDGTAETDRPGDIRTPYQHDKGRVIHSAAFRRLQGKTQVMGVGECDFHRTRLTHSMECAQIGHGLVLKLEKSPYTPDELRPLLDCDLMDAACLAHDLGHPPFGHGGEEALHRQMLGCGGFEGNAQTLRIMTSLEKYSLKNRGIDPTRRLVLAVLKYPVAFSKFDLSRFKDRPPKCYYDVESKIVEWALDAFEEPDRINFITLDAEKQKARHKTFDGYLMELADDISYGVHDLEDIIGRGIAERDEIAVAVKEAFDEVAGEIRYGEECINARDILDGLLSGDNTIRKQTIAKLVCIFVTHVEVRQVEAFSNSLLKYRATLPVVYQTLLTKLNRVVRKLAIHRAEVQQLEQRGKRIVEQIFLALNEDPQRLTPRFSNSNDVSQIGCPTRRVCDYIANMTDTYAEKIYMRLFIPGYGSARDEI